MALALLAIPAAGADEDTARREKLLALNNLTGSDAMQGKLKAMMADSDGTKKLLVVAVKMAKEKDQPFNYNAAFVLGRAAQDLKNVDACEVLYKICTEEATKLRSGQKLAESFGGLIDLYYENKKFDKTVKLCREFLEMKGDETVNRLKPAVMERMIQSMTRQGKIDEALKLAETLVKAEEEEKGWWSLQLKAWVLREGNRPEESAKTYEIGAGTAEPGKDAQAGAESPLHRTQPLHPQRRLCGHEEDRQGRRAAQDALEGQTERSDLQQRPRLHLGRPRHEPGRGREADSQGPGGRTARCARPTKSLRPEEDKDNAAYLDSMGWVLYKQKKYKEARKYLEDAIKDEEGRHIEIYDHLGDVLKALGLKAEAADAWKKGVEVAGTSKREQKKKEEVEKKLKDNS